METQSQILVGIEMRRALKQPALSVAKHLQQAKKFLICYLDRSLKALNAEISERNIQMTMQLDELPEAKWIRTLPGAGDVLAPALLACLGRDPERFGSVADARTLMGTVPVTKAVETIELSSFGGAVGSLLVEPCNCSQTIKAVKQTILLGIDDPSHN